MNYSKWSDTEIARAVALHISEDGLSCIGASGKALIHEYASGLCIGWKEFDPCNSWADAGPIIEKHLICLAADVFAEPQDGGKWVAQPAYGWDSERIRHDNPLRAAMVVFLQTREKPDA
ncbi:phage protein NinX family protein [Pantoea piersonii]|uniref:phage protein NinX family protein n=1 Tax=Pantoea piersonii TaxID=2364647 RepID=UPI00289CEB02|nr:phage protein NinX family protein [Pantoea piersonii]